MPGLSVCLYFFAISVWYYAFVKTTSKKDVIELIYKSSRFAYVKALF